MCIGFHGAEAALLFFESFSLGAAGGADSEALVIGESGVGDDAAAVGTFGAFGSVGGFVGAVAFGTPIAAAIAEASVAVEIFAALAADLDGEGGFFDEGVAAGLAFGVGVEVGAGAGGFV